MAALLIEDERILVARRLPGAHLGGRWEFPGGKIEPGETAGEALVRELREELGIGVRAGPAWSTLVHRYAEHTVRLHFRFAERVEGEPEALGCSEFRWATAPDLAELTFPEADCPLVESLLRAHAEGRPLRTARPDDESPCADEPRPPAPSDESPKERNHP